MFIWAKFLGGGVWAGFRQVFGRVFGQSLDGFLVFLCIFWAGFLAGFFGKRRCTDRSLYSIKIAFKSITEPSALY